MATQPFIDPESRPDLTVDMEARVGDLTVRQLSEILGRGAGAAPKLKEAIKEKESLADKFPGKEHKDAKDQKEHKEQKDHKEPKDHKDQKDQKEHKEPKDQKDQKEQKDHKEHKDNKDHKDLKDHVKDSLKEHKEFLKEKESLKEIGEGGGKGPAEGSGGTPVPQQGLEDLIRRVSGLEQEVTGLRDRVRGQES